MHILLFDIDGTLIRSGGAGKEAMEGALRSEFGLTDLIDGVPYSGRTDPSISHDLLAIHGVDPSDENIARLRVAYLERLPDALKFRQGVVLPGVRELLDRLLHQPDIVMGLLTGNVRDGAECKLGHFDLWRYFPFGAFGDGIHDRDDIARGAITIIANHTRREVIPESVWVIGDTPLDVKCARAIGAKAVAVATGWDSFETLERSGADYVLRDFREVDHLLAAWGV
jgi:phosphoglycolate phosphatase-like HAD superfamily hydrolase